MAEIDVIYDSDRPNAHEARTELPLALQQAGRPAGWRKWLRIALETPESGQRLGSPTILVGEEMQPDLRSSTAPIAARSTDKKATGRRMSRPSR